MKIYLASRYSRREELKKYRDKLVAAGHEVITRWLDTTWESDPTQPAAAPPEYREKYAILDLEDVERANCLIAFTEKRNEDGGRGGRHVEFGYALALAKYVIVVGPLENIFHHHPGVIKQYTLEEWNEKNLVSF